MTHAIKHLSVYFGLVFFLPVLLHAQTAPSKEYLCRGAWELSAMSFDYTTCIDFGLESDFLAGENYDSGLQFDAKTDSVVNLKTGLKKPFGFVEKAGRSYLVIGDELFLIMCVKNDEYLIALYDFQHSISGPGYYFNYE